MHFIKSRLAWSNRQTDGDDKAELVWLWTSSISYLSMTLSDWHYIYSQLMTWKAPCIFGVIFLKSHVCLKVIQHTHTLFFYYYLILIRYRDMLRNCEFQKITCLIKLCTGGILVHCILIMRQNTHKNKPFSTTWFLCMCFLHLLPNWIQSANPPTATVH